ncbi:MAG: alpha/beta hydrolase fold domain-containing protein [Planctomycetota bacterium]
MRSVTTIIAAIAVSTVVIVAAQESARPGAAGSLAARFQQYDKNGDGKLTPEEFPAAKVFDNADADKDGFVTPQEITAYFRKQQAGTPLTTPKSLPKATAAPTASPGATLDVAETLNVPYTTIAGVDPNLLSLDIHSPQGAKDAPVVAYVHGGYWKAGDKANKGHLAEFFCQHGFVFVTLNYRLAPAVRHPALIQDVARAVAWVHDHIAEHGGDPAQLFLTGHSAGAHLVALLGTDAKRLGEQGKPLSILRAVVPLDSAAMDILSVAANDRRADSPYRAAFGNDPADWADASPLVHAESATGLPPFQIVVAYGPAIANKKAGVDAFATALRRNGTRAEVVDASAFREHQSLMTEFGAEGDPVSAAVLEFIESVWTGKAVAGLGGERVLKAEGMAAEEAAKKLEAYRTRVVMRQFDKNENGRITRDEMQSQPFLFERLDANKDGAVTADELNSQLQREPPVKQPVPSTKEEPPVVSRDTWKPVDENIGSASVSYRDPEFLQQGGLVTFADQNGDVWVGEMDLQTGRFAKAHGGCDHQLDVPVSKWSRYCNGPEWGLDASGPAVFYIKDNAHGTGQLWRAAPPWDCPEVTQLTRGAEIHNWICEPSVNTALPTTRVIIYRGGGPRGGNVSAWINENAPTQTHAFTNRAYLARFSIDTPFITWSPRLRAGDRSTTQVSLLDTETGKVREITADGGAKYDPWLWHAPEFDGEVLLCVNLDERAIAIYRDMNRDKTSPWSRIAEIRLPADAPHPQLKSCEPVNGGRGAFGRSWFAAQAGDDSDNDTSIWLLGFEENGAHTVRRLDDGMVVGKTARRLDPESLVGERELFVYYNHLERAGASQLRLCRTGVLYRRRRLLSSKPPRRREREPRKRLHLSTTRIMPLSGVLTGKPGW